MFPSAVCTSSFVKGFSKAFAACFIFAASGSDWIYSRPSGTVLDPAAMMPYQFSRSALANFTGSVSISPCLLQRECKRRLLCSCLTNHAICCFLSCLLRGVSGASASVRLSFASSLTPLLSVASASAMEVRIA